jgi:Co/Zn/Cd efflux system component
MRDVKLIEGVITVREEHYWQYTDDKLVASLVLKVHSSVDHSAVVAKAQEIMRTLAHNVTVEVSSEGSAS